VDSNQSTAIKYNVQSIPNLLLFKNGKVVDQVIGFVPKKALADRITKHLS
jgi:thioredoxin 1